MLTIEPGLLHISGPSGKAIVERRVMQVLVELLDADENPVSRDLLAERCWPAGSASEDALNRAVAKVRKALAIVANGAAPTLETIRGVGYRLTASLSERSTPDTNSAIAAAIDPEARALGAMFEGTADGVSTAIHYLEQATEERAHYGPVWGSLAMAHILSLPFVDGDQSMVTAAKAREAAERAQQLQPNEGRSFAALAALEPTYGAWKNKHGLLSSMARKAPTGTPPLMFQQALYLAGVGAMDEALRILGPLAAAAPLVPWIQSAHAHALAATGRVTDALRSTEASFKRWPKDRLIWFTRFHLALAGGEVSTSLQMSLSSENLPANLSELERGLAAQVASAVAVQSPLKASDVVRAYEAAFDGSQSIVEQAVLASAHLGMPETSVRLLHYLYTRPLKLTRPWIAFPKIGLLHSEERNTALMFLSPLAGARQSAGFTKLLEIAELNAAPRTFL